MDKCDGPIAQGLETPRAAAGDPREIHDDKGGVARGRRRNVYGPRLQQQAHDASASTPAYAAEAGEARDQGDHPAGGIGRDVCLSRHAIRESTTGKHYENKTVTGS